MFKDDITFTSTREMTPEGYLKARATVTCVGVQEYAGQELIDLMPNVDLNRTYQVFRPPEVVFSQETIDSLKLKPITLEHPGLAVDSSNYKDQTVGWCGEDIKAVNDKQLETSLVITDENIAEYIKEYGSELSLGYDAPIRQESGVYQDQPYDMIFDGPMIINHLAIVQEGRCGNNAKILDSKNSEVTMKSQKTLVKDMDMDGLVNKISEKLMPDMQELISSDKFQEQLADRIGNMLAQSFDQGSDDTDLDMDDQKDNGTEGLDVSGKDMDKLDEEMPDQRDEQGAEMDLNEAEYDESEDMLGDADKLDCNDSKKSLKRKFKDTVHKRISVMDMASKISNKDYKKSQASNKAILVDSLSKYYKKESLTKKSVDYLCGLAQSIVATRKAGSDYLTAINDEAQSNSFNDTGRDVNQIDASFVKKLKKRGSK